MTAALYDQVPYEAKAVSHASLHRMATTAFMRGLETAPPTACRVLELGCADATHLLPLALAYPESSFTGVDFSDAQLERGRSVARELGLSNLKLVHADIEHFTPDGGPFDYVIVHGVYSWVSETTRRRILTLLQSELAEHGVAFLSYNTHPGWGLRQPLRDLLRLHTATIEAPLEKVAAARAHLEHLHALRVGGDQDPYGLILGQIIGSLLQRGDAYLLHEYLCSDNRAFSVVEMIDELEAHELKLLDDLVPATRAPSTQNQLEVALHRMDLPIREVEATTDLLTFRQFRASLVARQGQGGRPQKPSTVFERCEVASPLRPIDTGPWGDGSPQAFGMPDGAQVMANTPMLRGALTLLGEIWPASLPFSAVLERAASLVVAHMPTAPELGPKEAEETFTDLMRLRGLGFVDVRAHAPALANHIASHPEVGPLTRLEALRGRAATNRLHEPVELDPVTRALAVLADGSRDHGALAAEIGAQLTRAAHDEPPPNPEEVTQLVRDGLRRLRWGALLLP